MTRLCTICARGGSKGVRGKNLRPLLGKPLIAHSLQQAHAKLALEPLHVLADRHRSHAERPGGRGEAACGDRFHEPDDSPNPL